MQVKCLGKKGSEEGGKARLPSCKDCFQGWQAPQTHMHTGHRGWTGRRRSHSYGSWQWKRRRSWIPRWSLRWLLCWWRRTASPCLCASSHKIPPPTMPTSTTASSASLTKQSTFRYRRAGVRLLPHPLLLPSFFSRFVFSCFYPPPHLYLCVLFRFLILMQACHKAIHMRQLLVRLV